MYAVYRAKRHVQHPGYLLPGAVVQVTVTEYQLLLAAGKPVDCRIDGFLETHQIRHLFRHISLDGVDFLKASDKRGFCWLVWIVVRFEITA